MGNLISWIFGFPQIENSYSKEDLDAIREVEKEHEILESMAKELDDNKEIFTEEFHQKALEGLVKCILSGKTKCTRTPIEPDP